ncbi:Dabb family protein [Mycobacterium sp. 852002-51057_SCH5723018]|uniref:Dabb family protein n=1 Tax=Mycobacterium sp. 852002-51057_SCH5723018 TaxID=1834094 RepID=UPI0007FCB492|nr:Dabb family protein [Mycobacterium sp. 852002-51057_SCH5723018]OBG30479.1 stress responsive protein [Mycobacterium sp. 852002-51057_SCH5723018]
MYSVVRLLDVVEQDRRRLLNELTDAAAASGAKRWIVGPTLPGARNGGDVLLHLRFGSQDEYRSTTTALATMMTDPSVTRVNGANYLGEPNTCAAYPGTVYRTLLLRVSPHADATTVSKFEHQLSLMPRYVPAIRAWQLSRVCEAVGDSAWTHVFEQQFSDVDGLMGPYLKHPIHWAVVDRWFDPECPEVIVHDRVCHSFCRSVARALAPLARDGRQ